MPELFFNAPGKSGGFADRAVRTARMIAAAALAAVGLVVTLAAAGVIAVAAFAIAFIFAAGVAVMWLIARISRPRRSDSVQTLEARKGPRGWTVETRRYSF
jgi:hypothetical protein